MIRRWMAVSKWQELSFILRRLLGRRRAERELDDEIRAHLELETQGNIVRGMSPGEARDAALRAFGSVALAKEESRALWGTGPLETLWQDVRLGLRGMRRNPGFTSVAVITLALGVGATTAIFSVVDGVLLKPLPYRDPDRLVLIWEKFLRHGLPQIPVSAVEFTEYRDQNQVFEQTAAFDTVDFNLTGGDAPERIPGAVVSAEVFPLLGVEPLLGRAFLAEESEPGRDDVVVVGHGLWRRRFGSDPGLLGATLTLNGRGYTVVGVMPAGFQFPLSLFGIKGMQFTQPAELWTPVAFTPEQLKVRGSRSYGVIGRLKPGVTLARADAEVQTIANRMLRQYPGSYPPDGWGATAVSLHEQVVGDIRPALLVLLGTVGLVLMIGCANVANLLLARAASRQKEMSVRAALGASRARLVRQLLTETTLLALLAGGLGLLLAGLGTGLIVSFAPDTLPRVKEVSLDRSAFAFAALLSLLASAAFGAVPALQASKPDLDASLKGGGGRANSPGHQRLRGLAVVMEFALALVLLVSAGLVIKSFWRLLQVAPGFDPQNVLTFELSLPPAKYARREEVDAFYRRLIERVRTLPGVRAVGAATILPLSGSNNDQAFIVEGRMPRDLSEVASVEFRAVTPDYFHAMGIPLLTGRDFTDADYDRAPAVAIVNQALARRHLPGGAALGKQFTMDDPRRPGARWLTVVGVAADVRHRGLNVEAEPEVYVPHSQYPRSSMAVVARTASDPADAAAAIRREVAGLDADLPLYNTRAMGQIVSESIARQRLSTLLLAVFAAVALGMAAVGIYGVMSLTTAQRTREIGIRMALGAPAGGVLTLIVGQGMRLALIGMGVGLAASLALTRLMRSLLFGVGAADPLTFIAVPALLASVALVACYLPARRAMKADPLRALRSE